jgi:hypothetical protein
MAIRLAHCRDVANLGNARLENIERAEFDCARFAGIADILAGRDGDASFAADASHRIVIVDRINRLLDPGEIVRGQHQHSGSDPLKESCARLGCKTAPVASSCPDVARG